MLSPDASLVIPTFNRRVFIPGAVESAYAAADELTVEIIVVDDGSTDGTSEIIENWDGPIRLIRLSHNQGRNVARNAGLLASTGTFVKFLDSDDRLYPGSLKREVTIAHQQQADIVLGQTLNAIHLPDGTLALRQGTSLPTPHMNPIVDRVLAGDAVATSSALYRRSYVADLRWDENLFKLDDWDWFVRACLKMGKIVATNEPSYYWCAHAGQGINRTSMLQNATEHHVILDKIYDWLVQNDELTAERARRLAQYYYKELRVFCIHSPSQFGLAAAKIRSLDQSFVPRDEERQWWMRFAGRIFGFENAIRMHSALKRWKSNIAC